VSATRVAPSFDERVAAAREGLSPAEQRVATFIADHREEAVFLSAADIARRLDTSDATVIRAVQSLGYGGLPSLKTELQEALRSRATPTLRLGRSIEELGDDPEAILEHALATELALIKDARETLRPSDFARAVELLARAERVVIQGVGPNASMADYFALRLNRLSKPALAVTARGPGLADGLLQMRRGDLAIAIAYERGTPEFEHVLDRAKDLRLPSIIITDTLGFALAGRFTVALSARRAGSGMFHLSSITMVVIDALLMGLAGRDRVRALDAYEDLQEMRARLEAR